MPPSQSGQSPSASQGQQGSQRDETTAAGQQLGKTPGQDGNMPAKEGSQGRSNRQDSDGQSRSAGKAASGQPSPGGEGKRRVLVVSQTNRALVEARLKALKKCRAQGRMTRLGGSPPEKTAARAGLVRPANAAPQRQAKAGSPAREPARTVRARRARKAVRVKVTRMEGKAATPHRGVAAASNLRKQASRVGGGISPAALPVRNEVAVSQRASPVRETNQEARAELRLVAAAGRERGRREKMAKTIASPRHRLPSPRTRQAMTSLRKGNRKPRWCCGPLRTSLPKMLSLPISSRKPE